MSSFSADGVPLASPLRALCMLRCQDPQVLQFATPQRDAGTGGDRAALPHFQAVELRRIVAGRDGCPAVGVQRIDGEVQHRSRHFTNPGHRHALRR